MRRALQPLQDIVPHIEFAPTSIDAVWCHIENEIIPQHLRSTIKIDVALVAEGLIDKHDFKSVQ